MARLISYPTKRGLLVFFACFSLLGVSSLPLGNAQDVVDGENVEISGSADGERVAEESKTKPPSVLRMLFGGNMLGHVIVGLIIFLSIISVYFIIEHLLTITRRRLMPENAMAELERLIIHGEINQAIDLCHQKENYSLATEVILAGLQRYKSSEFGYAEYRSAVEEAGEDQTGKLYRRTEVLNVIGAIAPMLGLTGTVLGMIEAFTTIASLEGMARPQELAGGIGQALITTLLGLLVAIPTMVAFSYFRNKIDSIVAEAGKRIEQIMMPLGRKK
jgi:biopolymer transport protein ExbB